VAHDKRIDVAIARHERRPIAGVEGRAGVAEIFVIELAAATCDGRERNTSQHEPRGGRVSMRTREEFGFELHAHVL
jgi:hypothetical protein